MNRSTVVLPPSPRPQLLYLEIAGFAASSRSHVLTYDARRKSSFDSPLQTTTYMKNSVFRTSFLVSSSTHKTYVLIDRCFSGVLLQNRSGLLFLQRKLTFRGGGSVHRRFIFSEFCCVCLRRFRDDHGVYIWLLCIWLLCRVFTNQAEPYRDMHCYRRLVVLRACRAVAVGVVVQAFRRAGKSPRQHQHVQGGSFCCVLLGGHRE